MNSPTFETKQIKTVTNNVWWEKYVKVYEYKKYFERDCLGPLGEDVVWRCVRTEYYDENIYSKGQDNV